MDIKEIKPGDTHVIIAKAGERIISLNERSAALIIKQDPKGGFTFNVNGPRVSQGVPLHTLLALAARSFMQDSERVNAEIDVLKANGTIVDVSQNKESN